MFILLNFHLKPPKVLRVSDPLHFSGIFFKASVILVNSKILHISLATNQGFSIVPTTRICLPSNLKVSSIIIRFRKIKIKLNKKKSKI